MSINAATYNKIPGTIEEIKEIIKSEAPNAQFVLKSVSSEYVFFNVVCKRSKITDQEIIDLDQKSRFELIERGADSHFKGYYKVTIK